MYWKKVLKTYELLSLNPFLFAMNDLPHGGGEFHEIMDGVSSGDS